MAKKILLIDDDRDFLEMVQSFLEGEGFEVDVAHNGAQANFKANEQSYDLVIVDIVLPFLSGIEFLKKFQIEQQHNTPVIIVSGFLTRDLVEALEEKGNTVLPKPFPLRDLMKKIAHALPD